VLNGEAEIILDKEKIKELWTFIAKIWFKEGKEKPNISIINVIPTKYYCWDIERYRMINFLRSSHRLLQKII